MYLRVRKTNNKGLDNLKKYITLNIFVNCGLSMLKVALIASRFDLYLFDFINWFI